MTKIILRRIFLHRIGQQLWRSLGHSRVTPHFFPLLFALAVISSFKTSITLADTNVKEVLGLSGESANIPCKFNSQDDCGDLLHSVRWYKNEEWIYSYSPRFGIDEALEPFKPERAIFWANDTQPSLEISPVQLKDGGIYRCDITYISIKTECPSKTFTKLITKARPQLPVIYLGVEEKTVTNKTIGPFHEGDIISLKCESSGGEPTAQVTWWNQTEAMDSEFFTENDTDGTTVGNNLLTTHISRASLLNRYDCQVTHETLLQPWNASVTIEVYVPPQIIALKGTTTVREGELVMLTCSASHARPAANITWFNDSVPFDDQPQSTETIEKNSVTFESTSYFEFTATRFDDDQNVSCGAANQAMEGGRRNPLTDFVTLTVLYSPVVRILPDERVFEINETSKLLLECAFEANPAIGSSVQWLRNGETISPEALSNDDDADDMHDIENDENNIGSSIGAKEGRYFLSIDDINRSQAGEYRCSIMNSVGEGLSENAINVTVLYPPETRMMIFPSTAIENKTDIKLICEIEDASPSEVITVRWYKNDKMFSETPEATLVIPKVDRTYYSNYSCQAENRVGWGEISEQQLLNVLYTPGAATLTYTPDIVVKGKPVTLLCDVEDPGNPPATVYEWKRGDFHFTNINTRNWTISRASLESEETYVCSPNNTAGSGIAGTVNLTVYAPPAFIGPYLTEHGALESATNISLTCQVECYPRCSIEWSRNNEVLHIDSVESNGDQDDNENNEKLNNGIEEEVSDINGYTNIGDYYSVKVSYLPSNRWQNHFSSVVSTLRWNMSAWPNGRLNRIDDVANYTCRSSKNDAGPGVSNTIQFFVEYPPENITLSSYKVTVVKDETAPPVNCSADGRPKLSYIWTYEGKTVSGSQQLAFDYPTLVNRSGFYQCTVSNSHGNASARLFLDVLHEPECKLEAKFNADTGSATLICEVKANPKVVHFNWFMDNETLDDNIRTDETVSTLSDIRLGGRFTCVANNSIGQSTPCVLEIPGTYIAGKSDNRIIIISIIIAAVILFAIIIAAIILFLKRKKAVGKSDKQRRSNQPSGPVSDGDRAFYENLPFHGLQPAPNKPFKPLLPDLEYADVDFQAAGQPVDGTTPQRPPRSDKTMVNNNHA